MVCPYTLCNKLLILKNKNKKIYNSNIEFLNKVSTLYTRLIVCVQLHLI